GLCCFEKLEAEDGRISYTQIPCRYLDVVTRQCRIFDRRLEINPSCIKLTPALVSKLHWLPMHCGYRSDLSVVPKKNPRRRR
ncbi:MAG: hypothetical protein Q7U44_11260, partial [Desulfuromonadales bacterium]|nr:hypothetical protein [Desulfuromonadales bacterium]